MSFGSVIFTNKGKTLQAKAQSGAQLVFTRIAMGDGSLTGQSIRDLNNLINHKKNIPITRIHHYVDGTAKVGGELTNQDMTQGFYWREIGLFATDPDVGEVLYCYGNAAELAEYIPPGDGSQIIERVAEIVAIIGNAANVSAIINSSLIYLTMEDFEAHNTSDTAHQDIRQQLIVQSEQISDLLAPATTTKLGRVKVGANLAITSEGVLSGAAPYTHPGSGTNPHGTTKTDVGLGSVLNYGIASTAEAQAGTSDTKYVTPLKVAQYAETRGVGNTSVEYSGGNLNTLIGNIRVKGLNMVSAPDADWWYVDQVVHAQGSWQYQIATGLTTTRKKERWLLNSVWRNWQDANGGDIVGKIFQRDTFSLTTLNTTYVEAKTFTYASGGMVEISIGGNSTVSRIYVDGVLKIEADTQTIMGGLGGEPLRLPFNSSFSIQCRSLNVASATTYGRINYYLNP